MSSAEMSICTVILKIWDKALCREIGNTHTRYNIITKARKHYKIVVFSVKGIYALASN